jgi:hypothetical protein
MVDGGRQVNNAMDWVSDMRYLQDSGRVLRFVHRSKERGVSEEE